MPVSPPSPANRRYRCADGGYIAVACEREAHWRVLAKCVGRPELAYAGSWQAARAAAPRGLLARVLESLFAEDASEVWMKRLRGNGVPCRKA